MHMSLLKHSALAVLFLILASYSAQQTPAQVSDGKTDFSAYDPINGLFYTCRSSSSVASQFVFGQNGDYPVAIGETH